MKVFLACVLLAIVLVEAKRRGETKMEKITNCAILNLCSCEEKGIRKVGACYDKMQGETKDWFIKCLNECNIAPKFNSTTLNDNVENACGVDKAEATKCAEDCGEKFKPYMTNLYSDLTKTVTMGALNAAQACFSSVIMDCESFPGSCI